MKTKQQLHRLQENEFLQASECLTTMRKVLQERFKSQKRITEDRNSYLNECDLCY